MNYPLARMSLSQLKIPGLLLILLSISGLLLVVTPVMSVLGTVFFIMALLALIQPKWGIFCSLAFSFVLPPFPETSDSFPLFHVGFALLVACVIVGWFCRLALGKICLRRPDLTSPASLTLLCFIIMLMGNFLVAFLNEVETYEWIRGVSPFLVLAYYFVFFTEFRDEKDIERVAWLLKAGLIWFALESIIIYLAEQNRVTLYDFRLIIPYTVIGGIIYFSQFLKQAHGRRAILYLALWILCVIATLLSLTRGLILALAIGCAFLLLKKVSFSFLLRRYLLVKLLVILLPVALLVFLISGLRDADLEGLLRQRYDDSSTIDGRLLEMRAAYNEILTSPIIGKGFGFRYVTPFGLAYEGDRMRYIHNCFPYFLLTSGLIGLVLYLGLYAFSYKGLTFPHSHRWDTAFGGLDPHTIQALLISMLFYCTTSATYRTFQYNMLLSFFLFLAFVWRSAKPRVQQA